MTNKLFWIYNYPKGLYFFAEDEVEDVTYKTKEKLYTDRDRFDVFARHFYVCIPL